MTRDFCDNCDADMTSIPGGERVKIAVKISRGYKDVHSHYLLCERCQDKFNIYFEEPEQRASLEERLLDVLRDIVDDSVGEAMANQ